MVAAGFCSTSYDCLNLPLLPTKAACPKQQCTIPLKSRFPRASKREQDGVGKPIFLEPCSIVIVIEISLVV